MSAPSHVRSTLMALSFALSIVTGIVLSRGRSDEAGRSARGAHAVVIGLSLDTLKEARWQAGSRRIRRERIGARRHRARPIRER